MRKLLALFVFATVLVAAGCGSDGDSSSDPPAGDADTTDDVASIDGDQVDSTDDGLDAPATEIDDFAIAVVPNGRVISDDDGAGARVVLVSAPVDDRDAAVAFYDDWTEGQDMVFQRIEADGGGVSWIGDGQVIQVLTVLDGDDEVLITLTVNNT